MAGNNDTDGLSPLRGKGHVGVFPIPGEDAHTKKRVSLLARRVDETACDFGSVEIKPLGETGRSRVRVVFTPLGSFAPYVVHMITGLLVDGVCLLRTPGFNHKLIGPNCGMYTLEMVLNTGDHFSEPSSSDQCAFIWDTSIATDHNVMLVHPDVSSWPKETKLTHAQLSDGDLSIHGFTNRQMSEDCLRSCATITLDGQQVRAQFVDFVEYFVDDRKHFVANYRVGDKVVSREFSVVHVCPITKS